MMGHKRTTKKSNFATTAFVLREHLGVRGQRTHQSVSPTQHEDHGIAVRVATFSKNEKPSPSRHHHFGSLTIEFRSPTTAAQFRHHPFT